MPKFRVKRLTCLIALTMACLVAAACAESGLPPGDAIEPFSSNVVTGPLRGKQHCFICDTAPGQVGLIFFTHQPDASTARLVKAYVKAVDSAAHGNLLTWTVVLGPSGTDAEVQLEKQVWDYAHRNAMMNLTLTALGRPNGPPGYEIAPDAAVAVILYQDGKVLMNASWPLATWSSQTADSALAALTAQLKQLVTR